MLDWTALHPYNAIHVVRIPSALDVERLRAVIQSALESLGLTNFRLGDDRRSYQFRGGPVVCEIKVIEDNAATALATEIERQLNEPFSRGEVSNPFRFFVVDGSVSFTLGLAYFHPIADAEAVVRLLQHLVDTYQARSTPARPAPPSLLPGAAKTRAFLHPVAMLQRIAAVPALFLAARTFCRPHYQDPQQLQNGFTFFPLEAGALSSLRTAAKAWGVTLNDLFLALLIKSLLPLAATQLNARRRKIAVGCIVNVRKELGVSSHAFGLFLGSFFVAHEIRENASLKELAAAVGQQTARMKSARLYLGTPIQLAVIRLAMRFFSTKGTRTFYQKQCPLWGGITNMNINPLWEPTTPGNPPDYFRAVSTGPVTPLVLSVTTAAERVNVGLSYRSTVFSVTEIAQVQSRFVASVAQLGVEA